MAIDRRGAFRAQALSDYDMLRDLIARGAPHCHQLHYLQMAMEKLAKAFNTPLGGRPSRSHKAFGDFVRTGQRHPQLQRACGFTRGDQFAAYLNSLRDLADKIEDLSPEGGDHPNPEYPWEQGGAVHAPVAFRFGDFDLRAPKMVKMLEFIASCFDVL
jgi:hypothetical protein